MKFCGVLLVIIVTTYMNAGSVPLSEARPLSQSQAETSSLWTATLTLPDFNSPKPLLSVNDSGVIYGLCHIATFGFGSFGGSDVWGYADTLGNDYAIMGVDGGVQFVNATTLTVLNKISGPTGGGCGGTQWRDMVNYGSYLYCVSECSGINDGLMIIDLKFLPDSAHFVNALPINPGGLRTSHNLAIDTNMGFLYIEGTFTENKSVFIHDLTDPENPTFAGEFGPSGGIHDLYVMNDTAYLAQGSTPRFSIWDVSDKSSATLISSVNVTSGGYVHNVWPSGDRRHVVTTEETAFRTVKIWNMEDIDSIYLAGEYLAPSELAHNVHLRGDTMIISHYESGIRIVEISTNPANPIEIGSYDTWPISDNPGFSGAWGAWAFSPNGYAYASNGNGQLFIFQEMSGIVFDTLSGDSAFASPGDIARVDIYVHNYLPIRRINIPFTWTGPIALVFDSASKAGLRTDYFEELDFLSIDPFGKKAAFSLISSLEETSPDLDSGAGPVLSLYFSVPNGAPNTTNPITLTSVNGVVPGLYGECFQTIPTVLAGAITICPGCGGCCNVPGDADNSGDITIGDANFIVNFIFQGGELPDCNDKADASGNNSVDIGDATYIVKFIFQGGSDPVCGTTGL